ncbi:V-type ATP synthase subunit A, partial [candidate division WOR-3 bacterium]|nr:V-type ATP synthase subunit A [candidate division WOR-3 bacterium]
MKKGKIVKVSGPLVIADNMSGAKMFDVVFVSDYKLMGEIIELNNDRASIQVYENTSGIGVGEPVYPTGDPLSVELGPGLLESIYDGTQRPLDVIREQAGDFITRGIQVHPIPRDKKWGFIPVVKKGDKVIEGDIIGEVQETVVVNHKIMIPPGISGKVVEIEKGKFKVEETVCVIDTGDKKVDITMLQKWPVRIPRPYKEKKLPEEPLVTGQRVIDTFFPIGKGGTACIPGPFGSGKTVTQHQLAKWADADVIVYVGCGERGNEMTDVLQEFPELKDPKSGEALMKRTVLIANTSNMPVAA